jgi:glutathione S-transferase
MELYTYFRSGNGRKVHFALEELGAPYTIVPVDLSAGASRAPEYLRINPNGKVPALHDGAVRLWESSAILLYLNEAHGGGRLLAADPAARAQAYQWLLWQPTTFNPPLQRMVAELRRPEAERDGRALADARAAIQANLDLLSEALGTREHLAGGFGLADIVTLPHLVALGMLEIPLPANIDAYRSRLAARPAWQKVLAYTG